MLAVLVDDVHGIRMALRLQRRHRTRLRGVAVRMRSGPCGAIARRRVGSSLLRLPARVLVLVARMDQSLMADEKIAACKGFGAYLTNEGLLFRMCSDMSL